MSPRPWGVTTQKGKKIYFHILNWQESLLPLPKMSGIIRSARFLKTGRRVDIVDVGSGTPGGSSLVLSLPKEAMDPIDTIVVLEM